MRAIATCLRYSSKIPSIASRAARTTRQPTLLCSASRSTASWPLRSSIASDAFAIRNLHASAATRATIPKQSNRLITEKSPYLLQHAKNPVDWYPWGEQAIQKAKTENKPIFLSIGYSTCHWCHVMEHESFENEETAKFMNEHFVNIKVDREENPAVDKLYMTYVQLLTGRGGWPLSVFLTPELEPFFGGTYFPPGDQYGSPGFRTLLARISEIWEAAPDKLREDAQGTMAQMKNYFESKVSGDEDAANDLDPNTLIKTAFEHFNSSFDAEYGGFTPAPKFPTPVQLGFLFDYYGYFAKDAVHGENAKQALDMALFTLNKIAMGGIHDHVGSGFHRYSTDKFWHVPHFEKMLYDQAQLLSAYVTAYKVSRDDGYANVARDIIQYVARDLQHPAGGFYSAEDADSYPEDDPSKKVEGAFYVWEDEKLDEILDPKEAKVFKRYYGVTKDGNVNPALDPQGELEDQNVLTEEMPVPDVAKEFNLPVGEVEELLKVAKEKLWNYREEKRAKPHCDDKILTSWNGLMISGLALAAQTFKDKSTLDLAIKAADFIHKELYDSQAHVLRRSYRDGPSNIPGCLDDYSYLIQGLLHLYEATFDEKWVQWAYDLQQKQNELFYDQEKGGFYNISQDDKSIPIRIKDEQDGAEPSANSVTLGNLVRLGTLLEQEEYVSMARKTVGSFSTSFSHFPYAMPALLGSFMLMVNGIKQIVLTGHDEKEMEPFIRVVSENFMPNKLVARAKKDGIIAEKNPIIAQLSLEPTTQAFVCENFSCGLPIQNADQLQKKIVENQ